MGRSDTATGAAYVVHLGTGTAFDVRDGVRLVEWDSLSEADREKLDSGIDGDVWEVGYRCGRSLSWELDQVASGVVFVVNVRRWFDRVNGNSYFAGDVVNTSTGLVASIPFTYGRGDATYLYAAAVASGVGPMAFDDLPRSSVVLFVTEVLRKRDCKGGAA